MKRSLSKIVCTLLLLTALYVVLVRDWKQKPSDATNGFKPIEVVTEIEPDSVFDTKYVVRIKRIEVIENEYLLHTDKNYKVGFVFSE